MIIELENENYKEINTTGIKIVDFYATWCGPCKMMATVLEDLVDENKDVTVIKINVDKHPEIATANGVMTIPTVYIYKDNQEINKFIGFLDKNTIEAMIKS